MLPTLSFCPMDAPLAGTVVVFAGPDGALGEAARRVDEATDGLIKAAVEAEGFKAKLGNVMTLTMPRGIDARSLIVIGIGDDALKPVDLNRLGGILAGALPSGSDRAATVFADIPAGSMGADDAAELALGILLRSYTFERYKTKDENGSKEPWAVKIAVADVGATQAAFAPRHAVAEGAMLARELTNEPANALGPVEFAERAAELSALGVTVTVMEPEELERLEMRALLGVAQGSVRPARVAVMEWKGGGDAKPAALVGKGVVFDTGGISIKPAASMEDMKGDMAGAAAVVGTMHALAKRKAKANVVGIIGLVENMPDGKAQRPGDIVRSKSGQTIEIINTDAEGRLVLADLLTHTIETYEPDVIIDLATLTGAVIVALGHHHAGMFASRDTTAEALTAAGIATGDLVWRLPLGKDYDSLIDSKFADMKNTGGRAASSITAAQFLKRFVGDADWVHLDVAGTAMGAPTTDISRTFGSGYGVRLLDRFIRDRYEIGPD